jgi:ribonuclease J
MMQKISLAMEVKIIRGENQIGGNIIEIATEKTRIILDAGLELDSEKNSKLPDIPALFDYAGYDAVFISHYHSDHLGLAYEIPKEIPLYMGEASHKIIQASDAYRGKESLSVNGYLKHKKPITVGDISVTPFLCDHSAFDSYMLLCESEGEKILYTGDFRSNGRKSFDRLLKDLPADIDVLVCEGTTLSREGYVARTEKDLEEEAVDLFRKTQGPVFVLQSSMNIDRIVTMYRAAKRSGRVFLQELYMADITSSVGGSIPNPSFPDVYAFITNPKRYAALCSYENRVGKDFISKSKIVMCVRASMLGYLKSLAKDMDFSDGLLLYSFWSGYREDENIKDFLKECEKLDLKVVSLHTSGHADEQTIKELVRKTKPKKIMPIHTERAEWFEENL